MTKRRDRQIGRPVAADSFDESAIPIWEQLAKIGLDAPAGTWDAVPDDLSQRIDEVVYGKKGRSPGHEEMKERDDD
jgi:hypothetical protein